jgi:Zn-dependent membrane protease YugP
VSLFIVTAVVPLLFGLWAQLKVKRTFDKYSRVVPRSGMTGAEAAAAVLREPRAVPALGSSSISSP